MSFDYDCCEDIDNCDYDSTSLATTSMVAAEAAAAAVVVVERD
jgi:hypothetical protein